MISVIIVEDQTLVREGLIRLLDFSDRIRVVGSAINGEDALRLLATVQPDVILLDIQMPGMDGFSFMRHYPKDAKPAKFILLTTFNDPQYIDTAVQLGAHGFLLKDVSFTQLENTIERVYNGYRVLPQNSAQDSPPHCSPTLSHSAIMSQGLTLREQEIFSKIAQGLSNKEIALNLSVSEGTVKNHVSNILSKLGVRDRTQAVIKYSGQMLI